MPQQQYKVQAAEKNRNAHEDPDARINKGETTNSETQRAGIPGDMFRVDIFQAVNK
jgi:hypothetical protein